MTKRMWGVVLGVSLFAIGIHAAPRLGGRIRMESETLNGAGTTCAACGSIRLGGSLGQGGWVHMSEAEGGFSARLQGGFWTEDDEAVPAVRRGLMIGLH